ncbi:hypothetical protein SNEBB_003949 [Seison nebaliae]|nr:hypothetical protein SNEBB_003949 [Seison nebaliae]
MPIVEIDRCEEFSAAHRLHSNLLDDETNVELFGKCNSANGHGHNYRLTVTLRGEINKTTGMLMNLVDLKKIIQENVLDVIDHKNIDKDIPYFNNTPSTTENVTVFIWRQLKPHLNQLLHRIKLNETNKNSVSYFGD